MTIADLIKSLIDNGKDRIKTPITGAFIWSFSVYNWRPITVLLFSDAPIEDRIVVINYEYCNVLSVLIPIVLAFAYTMVIPRLMLWIDDKMSKTKHDRLKKIYKNKENVIELKTILAGKILELKDAESGNKEKQDFLDQIEELKESNNQSINSYKTTIESYKNTISELNINIEKLNRTNNTLRNDAKLKIDDKKNEIDFEIIQAEDVDLANEIHYVDLEDHLNDDERNEILSNFKLSEIEKIKKIKTGIDRKLESSTIPSNILNKFLKHGIFVKDGDYIHLTKTGRDFFYYLKNKY